MVSVNKAEISEEREEAKDCICILSNRKRIMLTTDDKEDYGMWISALRAQKARQ